MKQTGTSLKFTTTPSLFRSVHLRELVGVDSFNAYNPTHPPNSQSPYSPPHCHDDHFTPGSPDSYPSPPSPSMTMMGPILRDYSPFSCRLEITDDLQGHTGCVNTIQWSPDGQLIISGSDDRNIRLWDGNTLQPLSTFNSRHNQNVFSAKFLPNTNLTGIVSCAADGSVHYTKLDQAMSTPITNGQFLCHTDTTNMVETDPSGSPFLFISCSDDGTVNQYDLRQQSTCSCSSSTSSELCNRHTLIDYGLITNGRSAHSSMRSSSRFFRRLFGGTASNVGVTCTAWVPGHPHWLALASNNDCVSVFDVRNVSAGPIYSWQPPFAGTRYRNQVPHKITDLKFDPLFDPVFLCSFSENNLFLVQPDWALGTQSRIKKPDKVLEPDHEIIGVFRGHRNERTMIKEANFFGTNHIVCGSDDGQVYIWDRKSQRLLDVIEDSDDQIVNCVQPHPHLPYILASGIDDSIKLIQPTRDPEHVSHDEFMMGVNPLDDEAIAYARDLPRHHERELVDKRATAYYERLNRVAVSIARNRPESPRYEESVDESPGGSSHRRRRSIRMEFSIRRVDQDEPPAPNNMSEHGPVFISLVELLEGGPGSVVLMNALLGQGTDDDGDMQEE